MNQRIAFTGEYHSDNQYGGSTFLSIIHTYLSGGADLVLGDVLMLPCSDQPAPESRAVTVSKAQEAASPVYHTTHLDKDRIKVELSATPRMGIHHYTFQQKGDYYVIMNLDEVLCRYESEKVKEVCFVVSPAQTNP